MEATSSPIEQVDGEKDRGNWANKTQFILSCLGYAIGIGNVCRFPYLCYLSGGGAFLVPYFLMLLLCGFPLYLMEMSIGQFASTGCISMFRICPLFKGTGFAIVVVNLLCTMYYNVIMAYPLYFLAMCLRERLPWQDCGHPWNTEACVPLTPVVNTTRNLPELNSSLRRKTPADEFFHNGVLQISEGIDKPGNVVWQLLVCNVISWVAVYLCIINGVRSVGKVVYFTATFPFLLLFVLFVRGVTLPGAIDGILFYIYPQWEQLANLKVWADAALQIFFSLGTGWGGIVTMASYNKFSNNLKWDFVLVPVINCGTSIFAGFVVFSVLGFMSHQTGMPISTVVTGGPGLAFVAYPEAITMLPLPHLWAILFFAMVYLLGIDSCFVQIETIMSSGADEYPLLRKHKKMLTLATVFILFLGSLSCITNGGMYVLQLLDWYCASIPLILICLVEVTSVAWIYGCEKFSQDIEFMMKEKVKTWWKICWKYITPGIIMFMFGTTIIFNARISYNNIEYPDWAIAIGWMSAVSSMILIPGYAIYKIFLTRKESISQRLVKNLKPSSEWGPALPENRVAWKEHILSNTNR